MRESEGSKMDLKCGMPTDTCHCLLVRELQLVSFMFCCLCAKCGNGDHKPKSVTSLRRGPPLPSKPYVSRAGGGNMGRDRIAWRVLLGRGEGRRRGGAGRRLCCSWSAGWSVSCGTVRGLVGRVAAVLPALLVERRFLLSLPCPWHIAAALAHSSGAARWEELTLPAGRLAHRQRRRCALRRIHQPDTLLDTNNEGNDHTGRRMTLGKQTRERIRESRSPGRMEGGAPGPRTKQVSVCLGVVYSVMSTSSE